jgi:hypothetical protein
MYTVKPVHNGQPRDREKVVVVDRLSLFRGSFRTKVAWARFRVVVIRRLDKRKPVHNDQHRDREKVVVVDR